MAQKIELPDVSLVMIETREHDLARLAVHTCQEKAVFGEVLVFTDKPDKFDLPARYIEVPDFPNKLGWSQCLWQDVATHLRTSHFLAIQWDSWIFDQTKWRADFLNYDYIGSPWKYTDGMNVGNGGFSLRSTRLHNFLSCNLDRFPCTTSADDDLLCRVYRPALESEGFTWAPQPVAEYFAFESRRSDTPRTFGFHGIFNWSFVLTEQQVIERAKIAYRSEYIRQHMWKRFVNKNQRVAMMVAG